MLLSNSVLRSLESRKRNLEVRQEELSREKEHCHDLIDTIEGQLSLYDEAINNAKPNASNVSVGAVVGWYTLGYSIGGKVMTLQEAKSEKNHIAGQRARLHIDINKIETALKHVREEQETVKKQLEREVA